MQDAGVKRDTLRNRCDNGRPAVIGGSGLAQDHTHGGQLRFMGMTPLRFRRPKWGKKYLAGHYEVGPLQLYVSRGVGCVGVSFRIGCPPEVTELTLRSAEFERIS